MNDHIVILTGSHLCHNPRVLKEATCLANAGYDVRVLGAWFDSSLKARDLELLKSVPFRFEPVLDATASPRSRWSARVTRKAGAFAHQCMGLENRYQLGYATSALSRAASRLNADLYIAHSESAMAVAVDLLRDGRRVGVDMEDWFSEDLTAEARKHRPIRLLRELERTLLTRGAHATCTSRAMSDALKTEFDCPPPGVVYNAFPWSDRDSLDGLFKDRTNRELPSIHWFSQTIGEGRGLEDLLAALPLLKHKVELHLRGNPAAGFQAWLADRVPEEFRRRILIHGLVSNSELLSRIAEHDIGFAGEIPTIRSRDLTVTNKILQYVLAGLAVVASDTSGHREVAAEAPDGVSLYPSGDSGALARRIDALLCAPHALERAQTAAREAARKLFCWDRQQQVLLESIGLGISPSAVSA